MCGLVGAAGALGIKEEKMVKVLLQLDTIRGPHSTGIFGLKTKGEELTLKKTGTPFELALYRTWSSFWGNSFNVLMGHNRYATCGEITEATAHPFTYGTITGVHNGTLSGGWKNKLDSGHTFDVDSEALYYHMSRNGVDETVNKLEGAFALVWYDNEDGTLNMTRNKERTLFFCRSPDLKTIFWASEDWMLVQAAERAGVVIGEIHMLKEGVLFSTSITQGFATTCPQLTSEVRDLEQYKFMGHTGKKHKPSTNTGKTTITGTKQVGNANTTGSSGNVVPFKDKKLNEQLQAMVGKEVLFMTEGVDKDKNCGLEYIDGAPVGECPVQEIRFYFQPKGEDDALKMLEGDNVYRAKVRHFRTSANSAYLTVDPRTVELYLSDEGERGSEVKK